MADREPIPGLPMQKDWIVLAVREGKKESNPQGGEFQKFYVDFDGAPDTYWRRKSPATVEVGEAYFGTVSEGNYGPIFKKESPNGAGGRGGGGGGARAAAPRPQPAAAPRPQPTATPPAANPPAMARMSRPGAQALAVEVLASRDALLGDVEGVKALISEWTDWFISDSTQSA